MASYRGHLMFASTLGIGYGALGFLQWHLDSGASILGGALTAVGGLLPDLDSDSGVPVRELFSAAATVVPLLLFPRLHSQGFSPEQNLAILVGVYIGIRYVLSSLFKRFTIHRGMFHSIPGLCIAGLATYLLYQSPVPAIRFFLAVGVAIGFLSHLVLDEIYAVDFMGRGIKFNRFAGSALKLRSKSFLATGICYLILSGLVYLVMQEKAPGPQSGYPRTSIAQRR
jgi:membrane-bound metal-dependent hydrolase YbcI (DUF457 family)